MLDRAYWKYITSVLIALAGIGASLCAWAAVYNLYIGDPANPLVVLAMATLTAVIAIGSLVTTGALIVFRPDPSQSR